MDADENYEYVLSNGYLPKPSLTDEHLNSIFSLIISNEVLDTSNMFNDVFDIKYEIEAEDFNSNQLTNIILLYKHERTKEVIEELNQEINLFDNKGEKVDFMSLLEVVTSDDFVDNYKRCIPDSNFDSRIYDELIYDRFDKYSTFKVTYNDGKVFGLKNLLGVNVLQDIESTNYFEFVNYRTAIIPSYAGANNIYNGESLISNIYNLFGPNAEINEVTTTAYTISINNFVDLYKLKYFELIGESKNLNIFEYRAQSNFMLIFELVNFRNTQ
ncbi:MAG: hypothetical protein INQ03_08290 [Candidatus Heimdallarchaeota archaeon]|nr:hypothetical protein [Candidatus Heimdallarchaeota archaeon]